MFLSVGILHLLPHVEEYEANADLGTDFPVGNSFIVLGFLVILFMEQVVFDVHGADKKPTETVARPQGQDTFLTRSIAIARKYHSPLFTEAAVVLHAVLESIVLGLTVCPPSPPHHGPHHAVAPVTL